MKNRQKFLIVIGAFMVSCVVFKANAIMPPVDAGRYPVETQCNPIGNNQCGPVAYSNNCIGGGSACNDRGCPSGTHEGYIYP